MRTDSRTDPPYSIEALRAEVPCLSRFTPLAHCSQAPPTRTTLAAADRFLQSWSREGMAWDEWLAEVEGARARFAELIGADAEDVAVFSSVSHATAAVASALDFHGKRNGLVLTDAEFPTVAHVWGWQARRGAQLDWIPVGEDGVDADTLADRISPSSRLVSVTHGHYETGALLPIGRAVELARDVGAYSFVDAYQTLGTRSVDVRGLGVDFLVCGALKYLMGVAGVAFLYVRPEVASTLEPETTGWFGRVDPYAFDPRGLDWAPRARRFDSGTPPLLPAYIAGAGIELLLGVGVDKIQEWVQVLGERMLARAATEGLRVLGPGTAAERTSNLAFDCGSRDGREVEKRMKEGGFVTSARGRAIRLAPHGYNTIEDVDRAMDLLVELLTPR